ncbi:FHA domain-containing protein [Haloarcula sp. GH36]|uniref:FHA domain-containing protein n=1 Tax=Haloarcula montana TaxID=3111776 RepID=UPI002D767CE8|nr:FHA domain-containing protein [Haloarcula sp. GH36]
MSGTGETVECPICGVRFDPTTAGGWCTNIECGEWQYDAGDESSGGAVVYSPTGDPDRLGLLEQAAAQADADSASESVGSTDDESDGAAQPTADDPSLTCPDCGAIHDDANFCIECGSRLDSDRNDTPESLRLAVCGRQVAVTDGDCVGRDIRAAMLEAGRSDDEAVRVHREHVRFRRDDDGFYLVDLGDNPTRLNDRLLERGDREPVAPGDELGLSEVVTATVRHPENPTG